MKLWMRAAGALKDQRSILLVSLSPRSAYRNPDLEAAIIKATNHNDSSIDYRNAQRVFAWIRASPVSMKPLIRALCCRMEKTQSWVVALKGLMLMHGIFCCKTPAVRRIGRLPFDLSHFNDGHSKTSKTWGFNAFIRSYYTFLDQRSTLLYFQRKQTEDTMVQEIVKLQKLQTLLDMLLRISPQATNMRESLILEAMDCVILEIFDVYSRICNSITKVLLGIYSAGKLEARMALEVLQKAVIQGEDLARHFEFCREFGVFNAMEVPTITQIPEEDITDLERIINGVPDKTQVNYDYVDDSKAIMVRENSSAIVEDKTPNRLKTIITDKWEVFYEERSEIYDYRTGNPPNSSLLPFLPVYKRELPDLISF
ncbi:putative clathrin assembly protein At1g25240 [Manihot esculenta]|uniref:ENTH domain-containing protein n=1 Tax=Manihot esculenta TaxID=3983 RepID=A0A2C9U6F5_MANES|nr:putative clathrin assembly protein At1g25240 [Manihot esculenta]OAY25380.1 hypothetical protein MANES_17G090000v8 [Manihot esculenta]